MALSIGLNLCTPLADVRRSHQACTVSVIHGTRASTRSLKLHGSNTSRNIPHGPVRGLLPVRHGIGSRASAVKNSTRNDSEPRHPVIWFGAPLLSLVAALATALLITPADAEAISASGLADAAVEAVASSGWLGPAVFVALYVTATVLLFPASVLTLAAGALFGPLAGTILVSLASTTGAAAAFLVSRYFARPWVESKIADNPRFKAVLASVAAKGAYLVFLLRLSPLVPFNLLNYALGLTPVPLLEYVVSSWVGMLPGTFAYVYLGGAGKAAVTAAAGGSAAVDTTQLILYGVGAVATLLATRVISSAATKALEVEQAAGAGDMESKK